MGRRARGDIEPIIEALERVRTRFGAHAARDKLDLLERAARIPTMSPRAALAYHELLLFCAAYPDCVSVRRLARAELERVAEMARGLVGATSGSRRMLGDSGVAHTVSRVSFTLEMASWLTERFPDDVELAWNGESAGEALDEFLPLLMARVERDGMMNEAISTREWIVSARGRGHASDAAWLLEQCRRLAASPELLEQLYEPLELCFDWRLSDPIASRTFNRFPSRRIAYQRTDLERRTDPKRWLDVPLSPVRPLPGKQARELIEIGRAAVGVRGRETDALTYAHPEEVLLVALGRGLDLAVFGLRPERRLPIESFFGFVLAKNRVPIGYGGGWVFFDRLEIGANIFDTFRGGESAFAFAQILRAYRQLFGVRVALVDPYQFGAGNPEAIRSGAFWFYYRLGFRPIEPKLCELAAEQWRLVLADRAYRTPARVLRRLARARLRLPLESGAEQARLPPDVADLGLAVSRRIGDEHAGDRHAARRREARRLARILGAERIASWSAPERQAFERLSLLVGLIDDLLSWTPADKKRLLRTMRAKGCPQERRYVTALGGHASLRAAWEKTLRTG
ncbi:MAG: hypothetical protein JSV80_03465 [Acidobacteriota bacterium]|nr:MAG: hypothetical protein JSV80_03465 [Acidobacteriota bacterium]